MNVAGLNYESVNDGEGVRTVIYVSGCSHNCYKCHNPQAQNKNYGVPFTKTLQNEIINNIMKRPFLSGITWSGGDPLNKNCLNDVLEFTNKIRILLPNKSIWLYSGYIWEECLENNARYDIIKQCDIFVDGRYIDNLRDITLKWRGSSNQRVIDIQKTISENKIILHTN